MSAKPKKEEPQIEMIRQHVRAVILNFEEDDEHEEMIRVRDVAPRVHKRIDRKNLSPALVEYCSIQGISQTVRSELRGQYEGLDDDGDRQVDFDYDRLPQRFNIIRDGERGYVKPENCTKDEVRTYVLEPMARSLSNMQKFYAMIEQWNERR